MDNAIPPIAENPINPKKPKLTIIALTVCLLIIAGGAGYFLLKSDSPGLAKCGDEICGASENWKNCPQDCQKPIKPVCGNKICETGEDSKNCLQDCPAVSKCGDNICDAKELANPSTCPNDCVNKCGNKICETGEDSNNCPQDCPVANACGDGACNSGENCTSCSQDCGSCPVSSGESRFGIHTGSLSYDSALNYIRELGEQIYVRQSSGIVDGFGWKQVKTSGLTSACQSCCDPSRSSCGCAVGSFYYCKPDSRASLPSIPVTNPFRGIIINRYDDIPPTDRKGLIGDYPYNHEDIYRNFIEYLVQGYKSKAKYWEVGNENEALAFWVGTPEEYADTLKISSEEIRQNCADCKVGISLAHPSLGVKISSELKERWYSAIGRICSSFDFIDAHFYEASFIQPGQLDRWKRVCPGKEFISTETGVPDSIISGAAQNSGGTMEKQAQDLIKYNTLLFAEGYSKIYWYLIDTEYGMGEIFLHNALIDDADNTKKPAFTSYKTMIDKLDYFTSITKLADGQYKYTFSNKNPVYVLWCDSGTCFLPSQISGTVKVTNYLGTEETKNANQITLTSSPVFVE